MKAVSVHTCVENFKVKSLPKSLSDFVQKATNESSNEFCTCSDHVDFEQKHNT